MKYPDDFINKVICGDCLEVMKDIPDNSIDLVVTDPPYNLGKDYGYYIDFRKDYYKWCEKWIKECFRILKNTGSIYIKIYHKHIAKFWLILEKIGFIFQNLIIWKNVSIFPAKRRYAKTYEAILFFTKSNKYTFNTYAETVPLKFRSWIPTKDKKLKGQMGDIWLDIKSVYTGTVKHPEVILEKDSRKKLNPCQMPEGISDRCILFSSNENDIILDIFAGTFTTCVSAKKLNRRFIGIELNPKYCEIARKRIKAIPKRLDKFVS